MLRTVLFDFDGTLGDTLNLCVEAFQRTLEPITGRSYSAEEVLATFGPSEEGTIALFLPPEKREEGIRGYFHWYQKLHEKCPAPFPGIPELLAELEKAGIFLGLVTGKGPVTCDISLRKYGLADSFDAIEAGSPEGPCKPEAIRRILQRFDLRAEETLYVGDMPSDIRAAREVGIETLAVVWASTAQEDLVRRENPRAVFKSVESLRDYFRETLSR